MRRRGYTPESIRAFAEKVGVAKRDMVADVGLLEHCVREDLGQRARRAMAVLRPLKVVIENLPEGEVHWLDVANHPEDAALGRRLVPFARELYIERDDFQEVPPKKWFRLAPGAEVRLKNACLVRCAGVVKDAAGEVVELRCTWDPASLGGDAPDGRKVKGTLHWVVRRPRGPGRGAALRPAVQRQGPHGFARGRRLAGRAQPGQLRGAGGGHGGTGPGRGQGR